MSTQDLQWLLVRKNSSNLVKQRGLARVFSREAGNIASLHSYVYSSRVNDKAVAIEAAPSGKGVVVSTKKSKVPTNAVAGTLNSTTIGRGGSRRA